MLNVPLYVINTIPSDTTSVNIMPQISDQLFTVEGDNVIAETGQFFLQR